MVARPVRPGDPRAVEHERHRLPVQRHVQENLVEGTVEERGVHGHHRVQTPHGQSRGRRDGVLFSDTDVDAPVREGVCELLQSCGAQHGRRDRTTSPFGADLTSSSPNTDISGP